MIKYQISKHFQSKHIDHVYIFFYRKSEFTCLSFFFGHYSPESFADQIPHPITIKNILNCSRVQLWSFWKLWTKNVNFCFENNLKHNILKNILLTAFNFKRNLSVKKHDLGMCTRATFLHIPLSFSISMFCNIESGKCSCLL